MIYLDTHTVASLYQGVLTGFSVGALAALDAEDDLRISPMVFLELEYLHEIKRLKVSAQRIVDAMTQDIGLKLCSVPFPSVVKKAAEERWTRDPFDRIILAQARMGLAKLITKDREMHVHYSQALA